MTAPAALGFIGIGLMGRPMALRLLGAGHRVTVWNRSRDKLAPVLARGAAAAKTPPAGGGPNPGPRARGRPTW